METPKKIKIALLGVGTVGTGVYKILSRQKDEMINKIGAQIEIVKILVRDVKKERPGIPKELLTDSFQEIMDDPNIQIVIEVMGGLEPARTYILEAFRHGKHVVSANKDLIAEDGKELFETAQKYGRDFLFEAAVAGGIPIIRPLKQCLAGNNLTEVMGIVNGTTNFILTKMTENGMEFADALKMAQDLGYAEADPTSDIEGLDAGRKMAIMASSAFNTRVTFKDVYTEGITKISADDIRYAKELGCDIKLLGVAKNTPQGIEVRVHPMLIPSNHALASVRDSFNAVFVRGDAVGDAMFYGRGAGEMPTGSAVAGDVLDVARNILHSCNGRIGCTCYKNIPIKKMEDIYNSYFLRIQVKNRPGVLANIAAVFGNNQVSIAQIIQKKAIKDRAELVVITDEVCEKNIRDSVTVLEGMSIIKEISSIIRVYNPEE